MYEVAVAGYIASDMFPEFFKTENGFGDIFVPGKLVLIGKMQTAVGGAVGNTGIALNKLGVKTALMAKLGNDDIASMIRNTVNKVYGYEDCFVVDPVVGSPYTLAIEVPGVDRVLLPYIGTNDVFMPDDVDYEVVKQCRVFHFGYPSLMRSIYEKNGENLIEMFQRVHALGVATSLDMALPDPNSEAGKIDWETYCRNVLPHADIFVPSVEELLYMVDRKKYNELKNLDDDVLKNLSMDDLPKYGEMLKRMGAKIVAIKCGTMGFYLTAADKEALMTLQSLKINVDEWANVELFSSIFHVDKVVSTTGSGDSSIAGLLAGIVKGFSPEKTVDTACATGAMCVQEYGSVEGIRTLEFLEHAIGTEMKKRNDSYQGTVWRYDDSKAVYRRVR